MLGCRFYSLRRKDSIFVLIGRRENFTQVDAV